MAPTYVFAMLGVMVTLLLAVFSYLLVLSSKVAGLAADHDAIETAHKEKLDRIPEIEHKLDTSIAKEEVYFRVLDKWIADTIHSPHTPERDALMDKFVAREITESELYRLRDLLIVGMQETMSEDLRIVFSLGLASVEAYIAHMEADKKWKENHGLA